MLSIDPQSTTSHNVVLLTVFLTVQVLLETTIKKSSVWLHFDFRYRYRGQSSWCWSSGSMQRPRFMSVQDRRYTKLPQIRDKTKDYLYLMARKNVHLAESILRRKNHPGLFSKSNRRNHSWVTNEEIGRRLSWRQLGKWPNKRKEHSQCPGTHRQVNVLQTLS